jgi:hypothetical protein
MIQPVILEALEAGRPQGRDRLHLLGSSDYLAGQAFSFVMTLDAVGAWPPISESHVEMDGAWALYEAWVKIQTGHADTALVYSYGKSSPGDLPRVLSRQLDPYYYQPAVARRDRDRRAAGPGDARRRQAATEADMAEVAAPQPRGRQGQPQRPAQGLGVRRRTAGRADLVSIRCVATTAPPITDGGVAIVLAAGDRPATGPTVRPGSAASTTASTATTSAPATSPAPSTEPRGREGGVGERQDRRRRAARPVHPPGADPARGPGPGRRRERSTRRVARWPPTR